MPLGKPTKRRPFFCKTCKITTLVKTIHLRSVGHRQNRRIRALLNKPCISFSEIGRRLGLSRERVRQIADRFCQETGRQRQHTCAIIAPHKLPANCLAYQAEKLCREKGLAFEFVNRAVVGRPLLSSGAAIIANEKCLLRRCSERQSGNIVIRRPLAEAKDTKFMLSPLADGRWLVVPKSKWPRTSTEFKPCELTRPGGKSKRHDWRAYIDAWHLLRASPQGNDAVPAV